MQILLTEKEYAQLKEVYDAAILWVRKRNAFSNNWSRVGGIAERKGLDRNSTKDWGLEVDKLSEPLRSICEKYSYPIPEDQRNITEF